MKTVTIIIQEAPYLKNNKAWNALRFAGAALAGGNKIRIFLLERGIELARSNHKVQKGDENLETLLNSLIDMDLEVKSCGKSMDSFNTKESDFIKGVKRSSMLELSKWVETSDNVLTF